MKSLLSLLSLAPILVAGCANPPASWRYDPQLESITDRPMRAKVAVLPFLDQRGYSSLNAPLLYLHPVTPMGPIDVDRVESEEGFLEHSDYDVRPSEDLARALAQELELANLFETVVFADQISFLEAKRNHDFDFYFAGTLNSMRYSGGRLSYFLTFIAPLFWAVGVPTGYATNELDAFLVLRRAYDDEIVWQGPHYRAADSVVMGLYYNREKEFDAYPRLVADACRVWVEDLFLRTKETPAEFSFVRP